LRAVSRLGDRRLIVVGLVGGTMSGLAGVGGGIVIVPMLVLWLGWQQRKAQSASLTAIVPIAIVGAVTYAVGNAVDWRLAIALLIGAVAGAQFGTRLLAHLPERTLRISFGVLLLVASVAAAFK
jgi:uncharacterized membrane protein YfcA